MSRIIVIEFFTLDGVITDPDGSDGTATGGWALRHGPQAIAGDKFQLGTILDEGVMLLGRRTWSLFARIWPSRDDDFARRMNAVPKLVASHTVTEFDAWHNSSLVTGDLVDFARRERANRDVIVAGSISVAHMLMAADVVDEYRLLIFPTVVGTGAHLFPEGTSLRHLRTVAAASSGVAVLARFEREN